jgi:hypothetical protein
MHAQQEIRIDEQALERELDAGVERSTVASSVAKKVISVSRSALVTGTPIGEPRHAREDSIGARQIGR